MVWESGKWGDFENYKKRQTLLDKIALILLIVVVLLSIIGSIIGAFVKPTNNKQASTPRATNSANLISPSPSNILNNSSTPTPSSTPNASPTPKLSTIKSQPSIPLEIIQATLTPTQLTYPFTGTSLKVILRNNTPQEIKEYNYRFFLDKAIYFGQFVGNEIAYIDSGTTYEMRSDHEQGAISELAKSCDFFGLGSGQYNIHLKISTDTKNSLDADTTGPQITDKLIPFTLITACQKK